MRMRKVNGKSSGKVSVTVSLTLFNVVQYNQIGLFCLDGQSQKVVFLPLSRCSRITSGYGDDVTRIPQFRITPNLVY